MACLGVHFALDIKTVTKLRALPSGTARVDYLQNEIEEDWFLNHEKWLLETDKAWDALHRILTDGALSWTNGSYPLSHAILGGTQLYTGNDYILSLKLPEQVRDIACALGGVTPSQLREQYYRIDPAQYGCPLDEDDYQYTLDSFVDLRAFYEQASSVDRYVLFTVDQ